MKNRIAFLLLACLFVSSGVALADPFAGSELLVGRSVKPAGSAQLFSMGLAIQFAPMNMLLSSQKDTIINSGIDSACNGDAACEAAARENSDKAMDALGEIDDDQWTSIEGAATDEALLNAELEKAGVPAEGRDSVAKYMEQVPPEKRKDALSLSRQLAGQDATSVMVEPNLSLNFDLVSVDFRVPMALYMLESDTQWNMGNLTVNTKFGHIFGPDLAAFGLSYGLALYLPTGTDEAAAMGFADLFYGPKFFNQYLTAAPYLAMGFDLPGFSMQGHAELVSQHGVRGDPEHASVMYGKYGGGVVLLPNWPLSLIGEVNGLYPIQNGDQYDALFGVAGVQLKLLWLKASLALQAPIKQPDEEDLGTDEVSVEELAKFSIIGRASFTF